MKKPGQLYSLDFYVFWSLTYTFIILDYKKVTAGELYFPSKKPTLKSLQSLTLNKIQLYKVCDKE